MSSWLRMFGPIVATALQRETKQCPQQDEERRRKLEILLTLLCNVYKLDIATRAQPNMTHAQLRDVAHFSSAFVYHAQSSKEEWCKRIKMHHVRDHLVVACAFWPRAFFTAEHQEAFNPVLRRHYQAGNHINPSLSISREMAARVVARLLRIRSEHEGVV